AHEHTSSSTTTAVPWRTASSPSRQHGRRLSSPSQRRQQGLSVACTILFGEKAHEQNSSSTTTAAPRRTASSPSRQQGWRLSYLSRRRHQGLSVVICPWPCRRETAAKQPIAHLLHKSPGLWRTHHLVSFKSRQCTRRPPTPPLSCFGTTTWIELHGKISL
ncbi:unnamed protein product, partial [Aphanomyces euteiches]